MQQLNRDNYPPRAKISGFRFGILSAREVSTISAANVYQGKLHRAREPQEGALNDPRLGAVDADHDCHTCGLRIGECPGHSGHHELKSPVINPLCMMVLIRILKCICLSCGRLVVKEKDKYRNGRKETMLQSLASSRSKLQICGKKYIPGDEWSHEAEIKNEGCGFISPLIGKRSGLFINLKSANLNSSRCLAELSGHLEDVKVKLGDKVIMEAVLRNEYLRDLLLKITKKDLCTLGFSGRYSHPSSMVMTVLNIPSTEIRPKTSSGQNSSHDHTTLALQRMCKSEVKIEEKIVDKSKNASEIEAVNLLRSLEGLPPFDVPSIVPQKKKRKNTKTGPTELTEWKAKLSKRIPVEGRDSEALYKEKKTLNCTVQTYMQNELPGVKVALHRNGKAASCIRSRIKGKKGRVRGDICGKRVDSSARCVIGPNPGRPIDEIGVPMKVAMIHLVPVHVTTFNMKMLIGLIRRGAYHHPGARYVEKEHGEKIDLKFVPGHRIKLELGWIVWRYMMDGDIVLCGRNPSLHRPSIMAHVAKIVKGDMLRLGIPVTIPYAADFDGDEMALHTLQESAVIAEAKELMMVHKQILAVRDGGVVIHPVQDCIFGSYRLSDESTILSRSEYCHLICRLPEARITEILADSRRLPTGETCTGRQLYSLILPKDFCFFYYAAEDSVVVNNGVLVQGRLTSSVLKRITFQLAKDYSFQTSANYLQESQLICDEYLMMYGASITLDDMRQPEECKLAKEKMVAAVRAVVDQFPDFVNDKQEEYICTILGQLREKASMLTIKTMSQQTNNFIQIALCGAKGSPVTLAQVLSMTGLQFIESKRVKASITHLRHEVGVKRRGMILNSFSEGLTPMNYFFHSMAGREGLVDTSVRTSTVGYASRKVTAAVTGVMVQGDHTVRDNEGFLYETYYGGDGIDPCFVEHHALCYIDWGMDKIAEVYFYPNATQQHPLICEEQKELLTDIKYFHERVDYMDFSFFDRDDSVKKCAPSFFSVKRLVHYISTTGQIRDQTNSESDQDRIITSIRLLNQEFIHHRDIRSKLDHCSPHYRSATLAQVRSGFSSKRVVFEYDWSYTQMRDCFTKLRDLFNRSTVDPGTMVGILAAQSFGEVLTQTTLDAHRVAGNLVQLKMGLPRCKELLDFSRKGNIETPTMILEIINPEDSNKIICDWPQRSLQDACKSVSRTKGDIPGILFHLDKKICLESQISIDKVASVIKQEYQNVLYDYNEFTIAVFPTVEETNTVRMSMFSHIGATVPITSSLLTSIISSELLTKKITGVPGIQSAEIEVHGQKTYIRTNGSNLRAALACDLIEPSTIYTNNVQEIFEIYGIEAAQRALTNEYYSVLKFSGAFISNRHLNIMTTRQCFTGNVSSMNRHGVLKKFESVLARCFETQADVLAAAGIFEEREKLTGAKEDLMVGNLPRIGTRNMELIRDVASESKINQDIPVNDPGDRVIDDIPVDPKRLDMFPSVHDLTREERVRINHLQMTDMPSVRSKSKERFVDYRGYSTYHFDSNSSDPIDDESEYQLPQFNEPAQNTFQLPSFPFRPSSPKSILSEMFCPS